MLIGLYLRYKNTNGQRQYVDSQNSTNEIYNYIQEKNKAWVT